MFYDDFGMMQTELKKYPNLSPLYGTPLLACDEWNMMVGDIWSGSYHSQFDTAWVAAHNINALINMIEQGLQLSIRYGGTFNGDADGCHDFPLTNCSGSGKPAYYAFQGFNQLANNTRLSTTGTDHMNFAAIAGKSGNQITIVLANYDIKTYLDTFESVGSTEWTNYYTYVSLFGTPLTYGQFNLTLRNLPWTSAQTVVYERYLVDDQNKLALVENKSVSGNSTLVLSAGITAPSVQVIKLLLSN